MNGHYVNKRSNRRACMKRCMDVDEAREVCKDREKWRSLLSAPLGNRREVDKRAGAYLGQRISIAIQRGNTASLLGTLPQDSDFEKVFGEWAQVECVELVNDGSGLAFGIVGGRSSGVVIKSVLPGGVADRDGRLRSGDMLLRIGAVSAVGMCARQAAAVLRQCGACVRLLVARPTSAPTSQSLGASPAPVVPSRLLADPADLEKRLAEAGHEGFGVFCEDSSPPPPTIIEERHLMRPVASIVAVVPKGALSGPRPPPNFPQPFEMKPAPLRLPLDMAVRGDGSPETLSYEVDLNKDSGLGLGITVAGYVCEQEELSGIFVKSISEGSSADLSCRIQVNDRIVEVDGLSLHGVSNHRAVGLLRDAKGPVVRLKALRYLRGAGYEKLQKALAAQDGRRSPIAPPSPSVTSLAKYSFSVYEESTVIETELESGMQIHLTSPMSPSEEAEIVIGVDDDNSERADARHIQDKWREILDDESDWPGHDYGYDVIVGTIMKEKETGLGISLEGTVRVVAGREVQARHYIRAIAPNGSVAKLGLHKVGDELLEVNGWRVLGSHHVDVVSRLRAVTSPVRLVCARSRRDENKRTYARNMLGGSLQDLLSPPQRLIKAKSESSVASLCSANTVLSAGHDHDEFCQDELERNKSRSLEPLSGLAMWSDQIELIQLQKEERGLGFSILDYLDPSEPDSSVIVVRSVVSGGAAAADGRLAPGDRLVSVNGLDVSRSPLAIAVRAIKSAPRGPVTIGVAKPLPCSTVIGGQKANGHSLSSQKLEYFTKILRLIMSLHQDIMELQLEFNTEITHRVPVRTPFRIPPHISAEECINSLASDDHTGMDSFHECLQEYGEGIEVVQICLEPEDPSIKDDISAIGDLSLDECRNKKLKTTLNGDTNCNVIDIKIDDVIKNVNGNGTLKSSKSDDSLDDKEDDMTITEDDMLITPRDLADVRRTSIDTNEMSLSKQQSKDISTSDEMVFAVTPTGLERISFEKYWKECDSIKVEGGKTMLEKVKSDESWKECLNSPNDDTSSFADAPNRLSVQENSSLLFIDHDIDGYETCLDDDSLSVKCSLKTDDRKKVNCADIKENTKQNKIVASRNKDNDPSAKIISKEIYSGEDVSYDRYPHVQEHIIKQMKSLRIEPLNVNITNKKQKKRSPTKPSKHVQRRQCIEYYNDQAECLEEYKKQKRIEEERKRKDDKRKQDRKMENKKQLKKKELSEESTDLESFVPGCHKCFLEDYAYALTKAYIAEAKSCKFCEVIRDILEPPDNIHTRRLSAPALVSFDNDLVSETDEEDFLAVPEVKDRRKSTGPLRFPVPSRRQSYAPPPRMTVSVSPERQAVEDPLSTQRWGPLRKVTLRRIPGCPLGVSIVGGKVDIISNNGEENDGKAIFGIFIKNVVPDSPAGKCGQLQTGDRILEVDNICVRSSPHDRVVQMIKDAGDEVTLTVQSLLAWNTDSSDVDVSSVPTSPAVSVKGRAPPPPVDGLSHHEIKITVTSDHDTEKETTEEKSTSDADNATKPAYSDSDSSDEEDERQLGGRVYSDKGVEIDRASAGAIKRSRDEKEADPEQEDDFGYTSNKIKKKYASLGDTVVAVRLERGPKGGLGLSLAGHRDRSRMAVFVCGLNPTGAAAKCAPPVKLGDEILEVNGIVLHGRCHLNASAIIKGLAGPVFKIILLRRKQALEDVAVKPLTQFPVALEEESEDQFAAYKGVKTVAIKKGSSSLGIMIIEGRHAEVGQGIFISDIQEGSAAEQAGLQIGDMILAVNKDSLVGCGYDSAAATLKRTEGLVKLTVCNPNKKDDTPSEDGHTSTTSGSKVVSRPTSRNQTPDPSALKTGVSRPQTPKPVPSPVKAEPPQDPATATIQPNNNTVIEISTQNQTLGILVLGGSDTLINGPGAVILEVYPSGAAGKDGRLRAGDYITECGGIAITKEMTHERMCLTIKQTAPKIKMTIHRPEPIPYDNIEVELVKKPGKGLGLGVMARTPSPGVYISDLSTGGAADLDGRLQKGDIIVSIDGTDLSMANYDNAAAFLKLASSRAILKVKRFKIVR